ncbi:hypothetical protein B0T10DRAFT_574164 [Thelonectria olida]|uniref:F-box domain-containing protein n=1 Tax=Thelonectria olida TaxID=1576542 RepID=A0A9P8W2R8_9HYPO|nr:hypothetical protein B0T10DRAFT_574164 [Thelonectria olida]
MSSFENRFEILPPEDLEALGRKRGAQRHGEGGYGFGSHEPRSYIRIDDGNLAVPVHNEQPLGLLGVLPTEILGESLLSLDLPSLARFRLVSRRAMAAVDSLPAYRLLKKYCPNVLRVTVSIEASHFDLRHLYETIQLSRCSNCDKFGSHLYLITCRRVCYDCFSTCSEYGPIYSTDVVRRTGISDEQLAHLPHAWTVIGAYEPCFRYCRERKKLYDRCAVGSFFEGRDNHRYSDSKGRESDGSEPCRFMAAVPAPLISPAEKVVDWGVVCPTCNVSDWPSYSKTRYLSDGLARHLEWHQTQQKKASQKEAFRNYSNLLHGWFLAPENQPRVDGV